MIPPLDVLLDGEVTRIEPDITGLVFAETVFGANFDEIPELALRVCLAYYHTVHKMRPEFVAWNRIHAWAMGTRVEITMTDN